MNVSSECRSEVSPLGSPRSVFERYLDVARAGRSQLAGRSLLQILTSSPNVKKFPPGDVVRNLLRATLPVTLSTPSARPPTRLEVEPGTRFVRRALFEFVVSLWLSRPRPGRAAGGRPPPPGPAPLRSAPRPRVPSSIHQMRRSVLLNTYLRLCYSSCVWRGIHHLHCTWSRCTSRGRGPSCKAGLDLRVASVQDL